MDVTMICSLILLCFANSWSYDQLVVPGITQAASSSVWQENPTSTPWQTVDGKYQQRFNVCLHTDVTESITNAWLRIDLRNIYSIKSIKFWYRNDRGSDEQNTVRLRGYSILVSNSSYLPPLETSCYTDPGTSTLPTVIENDCEETSRYIWFFQPHTLDGVCPMLEICEVQVFECTNGTYGYNCSVDCGNCLNASACNHIDGHCPLGCRPGWQSNNKCDIACPNGTYGKDCGFNCSGNCFNKEPCNKIDGRSDQCMPGWQNEFCNEIVEDSSTVAPLSSVSDKRTPLFTVTSSVFVLQAFYLESNSSVIREGTSIDFKVLLLSAADYSFQWFHNGYMVSTSSTRYKVASVNAENGTSIITLHITMTLPRDSGFWEIRVSNNMDVVTSNLTISVIPRLVLEMVPRFNFSIQRGDTLTLQCTLTNPEALVGIKNGSLVLEKDGVVLEAVTTTRLSMKWTKPSVTTNETGSYTCSHSNYPDPVFVLVQVTIITPEQKRCHSEYSDGILWSITLAESIKSEPCPSHQRGILWL